MHASIMVTLPKEKSKGPAEAISQQVQVADNRKFKRKKESTDEIP